MGSVSVSVLPSLITLSSWWLVGVSFWWAFNATCSAFKGISVTFSMSVFKTKSNNIAAAMPIPTAHVATCRNLGFALVSITSRSNFAHSASTSGIPILLSISSLFILLCNFKGLSDFCQRPCNVLVHRRSTDTKDGGRLRIGHLVIVVQTQHTSILLRQVVVNNLSKLL